MQILSSIHFQIEVGTPFIRECGHPIGLALVGRIVRTHIYLVFIKENYYLIDIVFTKNAAWHVSRLFSCDCVKKPTLRATIRLVHQMDGTHHPVEL